MLLRSSVMKPLVCAKGAVFLLFCACSTSTTTNGSSSDGENRGGADANSTTGGSDSHTGGGSFLGGDAGRAVLISPEGGSAAQAMLAGSAGLIGGAFASGGAVAIEVNNAGNAGVISSPSGGQSGQGQSSGATGGFPAGGTGGMTTSVAQTGGAISGSAGSSVAAGGAIGAATGGSVAIAGSGGIQGIGGASGQGGCSLDSECSSPDTITCSATCVDGKCQTDVVGTTFSSGTLTQGPRTGFWDANQRPHLLYADNQGQPAVIRIQPLQADGGLGSASRDYFSPQGTLEIDTLGASHSNGRLALLWHGKANEQSGVFDWVTQFAITDLAGTSSEPMTLNRGLSYDKYPEFAYTEFVYPIDASTWATVEFGDSYPSLWRGYVADPTAPPETPPFSGDAGRLSSAPVTATARVIPQSAAVVGSTLYLSGFDCEWWSGGPCQPYLILARYDSRTLAALEPARFVLSATPVPFEEGLFRAPALGKMGNTLAVLWNEFSANGDYRLGRVILNMDGSLVTARSLVASELIPKAVIETSNGSGLLVASRFDGTRHTLVVQRLNSSLNFVGAAYPIASTSVTEPSHVEAHLSGDGRRVLVTFQQDFAQHRILHAGLCQ